MATPSTTDRQPETVRASRPSLSRRQGAAVVLGALVAAFALANLGDVKVHWLIGTHETPLIVVVVLAFLLGIATDRLLLARARRKHRAESPSRPTAR